MEIWKGVLMGLFDKFTRNDANSWEKKGIKLANK